MKNDLYKKVKKKKKKKNNLGKTGWRLRCVTRKRGLGSMKKGGRICGYLGPSPSSHDKPNWSKGLKGKRPRPQLPHKSQAGPLTGYLKRI